MKITIIGFIAFYLLQVPAGAQQFFMCFKGDTNTKLAITVAFNAKTERAEFVKYKGQDETIPLDYAAQSIPAKGYATYETTYNENYRGKRTGTYTFTHSGSQVYVRYIRMKDNKKFTFTIDNGLSVEDGKYRTTPCF